MNGVRLLPILFAAGLLLTDAGQSAATGALPGAPPKFDLADRVQLAEGTSRELTWEPSARASTYDLHFGPTNPPPLLVSGITQTRYTVSGLVAGVTYFWYVVARAECDATRTTQSSIRTFTVEGSCGAAGAFSLLAPAQGSANVSVIPTLTWSSSSGAASYALHLGRTSPPPLLIADVSSTDVEIPKLVAGAQYYWRVVAKGCDRARNVSSPVASFTTTLDCQPPAPTSFSFVPAGNVAAGQTYALTWDEANGLDSAGSYLVERATDPSFSPILDSQQTTATFASFVSGAAATYYHRVRALAGCNPNLASASSPVRTVNVVAGNASVIFTLLPKPVITNLGDRLEDQKTTFAVENIGKSNVQVLVGRQEIGSVPFFQIVDPAGGDAAFLTLEPRKPKTLEIRFSGPPNNQAASYQGMVYLASTGEGLSTNPLAWVNLKVGGTDSTTPPLFLVGGIPSDVAFFPPASGDDSGRAPISVDILNSGTTPMELAGEIGPELWLQPETGWNAQPVPASSFRTVRLFTRRNRAPNGSALPRYTYFTVRSRNGQSARLLVQDHGGFVASSGRSAALGAGERSYVVPSIVSGTRGDGTRFYSRVRISNAGADSTQVELFFTPTDADGFDSVAVRRASFVVPANDVVNISDPIAQLFGITTPANGQIEIRAAQEKIGMLTVSSATEVFVRSGGAYATQLPGFQRGEGATLGAPYVIAGVTVSGNIRASLVLVETTGLEKTAVRVLLYDKSGNRRGEQVVEVPRHGQKEIGDLATLANGAALDGSRVEIVVDDGGGAVATVATLTESASGNGIALIAQPLKVNPTVSALGRSAVRNSTATTRTFFVPAVVSGIAPLSTQSSATYRTQLTLTGDSSAASSLELTYADRESGRTHTRTVALAPRQTIEYANATETLFGIAAGNRSRGWVRVVASGEARVSARLVATLAQANVGDAIPVLTLDSEALTGGGSSKPLYADGLEQSINATIGTRSTLTLQEVGGEPASVAVRLYEAGNRTQPIAEKDISISAFGEVRLETLFSAMGLDDSERKKDRANVACVVTAKGSRGLVAAVLTSIDNRTGETKMRLLVPSGGSPASGVQRSTPPQSGPTRRRAVRRP